jgi:hypothetical protein
MKEFIKRKLHESLNQTIRVNTLPEDLQTLLFQYFEDNGFELPEELPLVTILVDWFENIPFSKNDRGEEYANNMIGQDLPPIVISNGNILDGRHRLFAAKKEGKKYLKAIDLTDYNIT